MSIEKEFETVVCKILDYPGNVNKLLDNLSDEQQADWEFVNRLQVVYGKWGLSPLYIFYLEGGEEREKCGIIRITTGIEKMRQEINCWKY